MTNVGRMYHAAPKGVFGGVEQETWYDPGVGTGGFLDKWTGGILGDGLSKNVRDAYAFLAEKHREGDQIFLFGFSRGAYTVRSVAGMIRKCGLVRDPDPALIRQAYDLYRTRHENPDAPEAAAFRARHSREADVRFLGVWDTVGALGIPGALRGRVAARHKFHDVGLSRIVKEAYHAVAIDERRRAYQATLWDTETLKGREKVEQRWFVGVHRNVGGGYRDPKLSDEAFVWIARKAQDAGLVLDEAWMAANVSPNPMGEIRDSTKPLWWLLGTASRPMGDENHLPQTVAPQARRRWDADPSYRPENLQAWLRTHPWEEPAREARPPPPRPRT